MKTLIITLFAILGTMPFVAIADVTVTYCEAHGCVETNKKFFDQKYWEIYDEIESQFITKDSENWSENQWVEIESKIDDIVDELYNLHSVK